MARQSSRSACPIMMKPKDRKCNRDGWRYLWRLSRMIWRETHEANEAAAVDMMLCGTSFVQTVPQSTHDGLRDRLPIKATRIDPTTVFVRRAIDV